MTHLWLSVSLFALAVVAVLLARLSASMDGDD